VELRACVTCSSGGATIERALGTLNGGLSGCQALLLDAPHCAEGRNDYLLYSSSNNSACYLLPARCGANTCTCTLSGCYCKQGSTLSVCSPLAAVLYVAFTSGMYSVQHAKRR
jgi:hypothetical protein